ncbi:hypothetical protein NP493_847g01041 [Ridgeia piscesae]|uniref:oligopeptidase A n=1 Tax=Ridgeia piscesae TaxID=27915 RepID=A0AAD9KND0_RIDPI|nr:hypothetical protein NP493_847g01041 [Ridgeia piscesae]
MAASIVRCRSGCLYQNVTKSFIRRATTNAYYVLLPEIPPDTPEDNPIMRVHDYPEFSRVDSGLTVTGCAKLSIDYDVELGKHIESLKDGAFKKTFSSVFDPIEEISVPLNYAWKTAKNLNYVKGTDGYRQSFQRVHPQVERAKNERWISEPLYNAVKEVGADSANLSDFQQRLVKMYLMEFRLNGVELTGDDRKKFVEFLGKLVDSKNHFRNRVMLSHNMFSHNVENIAELEGLPRSLLIQMAADKTNPSRGPWMVNLNQHLYNPFMQYCTNRLGRWNIWQALNNRAAVGHDEKNLSNHLIIKEIRMFRKDIALLLGYENYAQMSMETKMAGSVENVMNMIESLKGQFRALAEEEINELQDFANAEGFNANLEMWDLPFFRRKHKEQLFKIDPEDVAQFFPLPKVLDGLFKLAGNLFGITVKDCSGDVDTWHEDVRFYRIYDKQSGEEVSAFYLDPYARPAQKLGGAWMEAGRENSELIGTKPFSYMNLNLAPPFGKRPSLLTVEDMSTVFYEFGHGLQQMLTTVPYSEVAGQRNVEWDALQVCARLMSMFLYTPETLRSLSSHYETGEQMSDTMIDTILRMQKYMSGFDMMRQLYYSAYDMEMYVSDDHWYSTMQRLWPEFVPMPLHEEDNHPCSFTAIFSDQYPAAYYSVKWAEMVAADVFKAFKEAGLENPEKQAVVGKRFRDTFLSLGGGIPAGEVFRKFRGRDPDQEAYIEYYKSQS